MTTIPNNTADEGTSSVAVVIAAHNEEAVIGRCLDALSRGASPGDLHVIVAANGCTDATVAVSASRPGVHVVDVPEAGKPGALNAAEQQPLGFPRVYLDADMIVTAADVRALCDALREPGALAAYPRREVQVSGRPLVVRAYYAIHTRLPVFDEGLFGRGMIAVSKEGRERFSTFPTMVADDLFLDSLFSTTEKRRVDSFATTVAAPLATRDLLRRLVRVRRGNAAMRAASADGRVGSAVRAADRWAWLRDVVVARPWLAPSAVVYVAVTLWAAWRAGRGARDDMIWGRDESSRVSPGPVADGSAAGGATPHFGSRTQGHIDEAGN